LPPSCRICLNENVEEINRRLTKGESIRSVAAAFKVGKTQLHSHFRNHVETRSKPPEKRAPDPGPADIAGQLEDLRAKTLRILDQAKSAKNLKTALHAVGEARKILELRGKLEGKLQEGTTVRVSFMTVKQWHQIEATIFERLKPFPAARQAVARGLKMLDIDTS
jgi:hypothetical protein